MPENKPTLIFVYNAKSGLYSGISDYIHKFMSPETYECNLCAVTYDNLGMKKLWKTYISNLNLPTKFLHNDEFAKEYPHFTTLELPCILLENESEVTILLDSKTLNSLSTQEILIEKLDSEIAEYK